MVLKIEYQYFAYSKNFYVAPHDIFIDAVSQINALYFFELNDVILKL